MSSLGYQIFGFAASIVSMLFLVPIICKWITDAMPSAKMQALDVLLSETEALLRSALEEGTIDYHYYYQHFHTTIWQAKLNADELRAVVYNISGRRQELRAWSLGISGRIRKVMERLKPLRGQIATSSSRGRQRLASMGCTDNPALAQYSQRDRVSALCEPLSPANTVRPSTVDIADATLEVNVVATYIEHHPRTVSTPALTISFAPSNLDATQELLSPALQARPPLCFKSHHKATTDARREKRSVLRRCGKPASAFDSAIGALSSSTYERKESRGLIGRIRAFVELLLPIASSIPMQSAVALPTSPPPPYALSEKFRHHYAMQWADYGYDAEQIKLPA